MIDLLRAEAGIRQLHARYTDAVFRKDYGQFGDCFTEDAVWHVGGYTLRGRAEAMRFLEERICNSHWVLLTFRTPLLELGEEMVAGRTYVTEQNAFRELPASFNVATYHERFVEQDGVWRRAWADFQLYYTGPADLTGRFLEPDLR